MFFFAIGFSISISLSPVLAFTKLFCFPKAYKVFKREQKLAEKDKHSKVPETVEEMQKLIGHLQDGEKPLEP